MLQLDNFHQKLFTIAESLTVPFRMLQSLATLVLPGEARTVVKALSRKGKPLLAIMREFKSFNPEYPQAQLSRNLPQPRHSQLAMELSRTMFKKD